MSKLKIGVFGSAFDPPTRGHQDVLKQAASFHDRILLVPSACHAFSKKMQPFDYRVEMLNCFIKDTVIESCDMTVCSLESSLLKDRDDQPVYTFDLMSALESHYGREVELSFIRGPDNADPQVWQRFYKASEIEKRWSIFTAKERIQARSSFVRQAIAEGEMDKQISSILKQLLLPSVYDYIKTKGLYRKDML